MTARPAIHRSTPRTRPDRSACVLIAIAGLLPLAGSLSCNFPVAKPGARKPAKEPAGPADAELQNARVAVVADFEQPAQVGMFSSSSTVTRPRRSTAIAHPGTGGASLELPFDTSNIAFWASSNMSAAADGASGNASFPNDWTPYQMLVMSVHVPRASNVLRIVIRGGGASRAYVEERIPLRAGWNTVRLDCEEIGRAVELTDVRQIEWSVASLREPLAVHLDDILLVDNSKAILSSRDAPAGSLYATHEGRRLHVGAGGRFELVFRRGLIVGWYDLQSDPGRRNNLVNETLGPFPVLLPPDAPDTLTFNVMDQWAVLGATPTITQSLVEASEARAVVEGEWRWTGADADVAPAISWRYSVYPSGRVFVRLSCPTQAGNWRADDLGVVLLTSRQADFEAPITAREDRFALGLLARTASGAADLLAIAHQSGGGRFVPIRAANQTDAGLLLSGSLMAQPSQQWAFLIQLWPADLDSKLPAEPIARDYAQPSALNVDWGDAVLTADGDLDNDGYNESEGVYVAAPKEGILRFTFNDEQRLRFEPTLKLVETAGMDVWVYADGRIVRDVARDANDNAIVRLADAIDHKLLVEVHCRARGAAAARPTDDREP